jgi:hypothetical protein
MTVASASGNGPETRPGGRGAVGNASYSSIGILSRWMTKYDNHRKHNRKRKRSTP